MQELVKEFLKVLSWESWELDLYQLLWSRQVKKYYYIRKKQDKLKLWLGYYRF